MGCDFDTLDPFLDKRRGDFSLMFSYIVFPKQELSVEVGYVDRICSPGSG